MISSNTKRTKSKNKYKKKIAPKKVKGSRSYDSEDNKSKKQSPKKLPKENNRSSNKKKTKTPKKIFSKKCLIIYSIIILFLIISGSMIALLYPNIFVFYNTKIADINSYDLFQIDQDVIESTLSDIYNTDYAKNETIIPDIFPANYDSVLSSNLVDLTYDNKVELLNYGTAYSLINEPTFSEVSQYGKINSLIYQTNNEYYLSSQAILFYYLASMNNIQKDLYDQELLYNFSELKIKITEYLHSLTRNIIFEDKVVTSLQNKLKQINNKDHESSINLINDMSEDEKDLFFSVINKLKLNDSFKKINILNLLLDFDLIQTKYEKIDLDNYWNNTEILLNKDNEIINSYDFILETNINETPEINSNVYIEDNEKLYTLLFELINYKIEQLNSVKITNSDLNKLENDLEDVLIYLKQQKDNELKDISLIENILYGLTEIKIESKKDRSYEDVIEPNLTILISTHKDDESLILALSPQLIYEENIPQINDDNFNNDYDVEPVSQPSNSVRIPVLMYHQIATPPANSSEFVKGLYVSVEDFEKQMAYLVRKNYKSVTTQEFYQILASGENPTQKTVMITFDDGSYSQYQYAYPILRKYGLTGVFFIPSRKSSISSSALKDMSDNGMVIDSHSRTHLLLSQVADSSTLVSEISGSKADLEYMTGEKVYSFAYPGCVGNSEVFGLVASSGYSLGFSCGPTIDHYYSYRFALSRVHAFTEMDRFINALSGVR